MKILIEKRKDGTYSADFIELPGSPELGYGKSTEEAIIDVFNKHISTKTDFSEVDISCMTIIKKWDHCCQEMVNSISSGTIINERDQYSINQPHFSIDITYCPWCGEQLI